MGTGDTEAIKMPLQAGKRSWRAGSNQLLGNALTLKGQTPLLALSAGRMAAPPHVLRIGRGGKSGLHGSTVPDNLRRGRPQGQCHRKQTALRSEGRSGVRVKGCGKSAPRSWQQERHGKPHREQDRIGAARERETAASRLSDQPPGLVARGAPQGAPQMNGHRPSRGTEPGLQAW